MEEIEKAMEEDGVEMRVDEDEVGGLFRRAVRVKESVEERVEASRGPIQHQRRWWPHSTRRRWPHSTPATLVAPFNTTSVAPFNTTSVAPFNTTSVAPFNTTSVAPFKLPRECRRVVRPTVARKETQAPRRGGGEVGNPGSPEGRGGGRPLSSSLPAFPVGMQSLAN
ncbi:hypothetical protein HBH99_256060 [Parastagonospora nodorum]|nr:hypothetical protein HBH99_256060 [Parastagonospora nodorum]